MSEATTPVPDPKPDDAREPSAPSAAAEAEEPKEPLTPGMTKRKAMGVVKLGWFNTFTYSMQVYYLAI